MPKELGDEMTGVLASQQISALIADGRLSAQKPILPEQVQPASLDLRFGNVAYRVRASFLAGHSCSVAERLDEFEMHRIDLREGAVLEKGCVYVVPLMEVLDLPAQLQAVTNAKSSTGRLDLLTRTITDGGTEFDRIQPGYHGPLYAEICPRSFSVLVRPGMRLNQIRFRDGQAVLDDDALSALHASMPLVDGDAVIDDGLGFSVDLKPQRGTLVGYRAKPHTGVIDLDNIGGYDPAEYWEEVHSENARIILDPGAFYILVSREAVHIPPAYAAEMAPYLAMVGSSVCITRAFSTPVSAMTQPAAPGRAACWKCAATRRPLCSSTGRSWGGWSMRRWIRNPSSYTARESARITRDRG